MVRMANPLTPLQVAMTVIEPPGPAYALYNGGGPAEMMVQPPGGVSTWKVNVRARPVTVTEVGKPVTVVLEEWVWLSATTWLSPRPMPFTISEQVTSAPPMTGVGVKPIRIGMGTS